MVSYLDRLVEEAQREGRPVVLDWELSGTLELAGDDLVVAAIAERTALLRDPDGSWRVAGEGAVTVLLGGREVGLDALPG